jgi:hypothetical protein
VPDKIDRQRMAHDYGFALAFMNSDPELKNLFNRAVKQSWQTDKFVAELRGTKWFKQHSASVRNAIMQETSDPATYKANVDQMMATVKDAWGGMFGKTNQLDHGQLRAWAETAFRMGWSQSQLIDHMASSINYRKMLKQNSLGGKAAEYAGQLDALASNFGVNLGNQWRAAQLSRLMEGGDTIGAVQQRVRDMAMRQYKAFADDIAAGATVKEIADPYVQRMADLLEMNPHDVSLQSQMIQKALRQRTPKGKPAAMDLSDFEDMVRSDPRWQYTDNARAQVSDYAMAIGRSFGVIA